MPGQPTPTSNWRCRQSSADKKAAAANPATCHRAISGKSSPLEAPARRINQILRERRGISADTAMRLARYFHGEAQAWMNLQARYDLRRAEISKGRRIRSEVKPSRS